MSLGSGLRKFSDYKESIIISSLRLGQKTKLNCMDYLRVWRNLPTQRQNTAINMIKVNSRGHARRLGSHVVFLDTS